MKAKIVNLQQEHKNELSKNEVTWKKKFRAKECEKRELEEKYLELKNFSAASPCKACPRCEIKNQNGRQTDLEKMWDKSKSHSGVSSFTPHIPLMSMGQGPTSLPIELVNNAHKEVRRLQELRRYIQEECDHLLLKKDRLKEEVGHKYSYPCPLEESSRSLDAYLCLGKQNHRDVKTAHSLWNMAAHRSNIEQSLDLSSADQPYKVVDKILFFRSFLNISL